MSKIFTDKKSLELRSVSGRVKKNDSENGEQKTKISPEKMNVIYYMFKKRIEKCGTNDLDKIERLTLSNINRLIATSRHNLLRK